MDSMAALPKDPLFEIFSRVDNNKDLFMFAVTCRWWLRRFTDPTFLHEICRVKGEVHHVRLLGFFFQETRLERGKRTSKLRRRKNTLPTFFPTPGSPFGRIGRSLTSFFAAAADETFNYAEPLAAHRGFVLMNLIPRTSRGVRRSFDDSRGPLLVGLCNPITGERHVLPPLYFDGLNVLSSRFAIITAADENDGEQRRNMFLQLLVVSNGYLLSYCASARSWSAMATKCVEGVSMVGERSAVVHRGAAHWLCMDYASKKRDAREDCLYKLSVEPETLRVSLTKLPIHVGGLPVLCVSTDNKLAVVCVYIVHVVVWTQEEENGEEEGYDGDPTSWIRTVIRIPGGVLEPDYYPLGQRQHGARWYHLGKGSLLLVYQSSAVFVLDLKEKVMKTVKDPLLPHGDNQGRVLVPYAMSLVDFFRCCLPTFLLDD